MRTIQHWIDGAETRGSSTRTSPVFNPATGEQQAELLAILNKAVALNMNAIILQIRPGTDALYDSKLEPWSEFLTGRQGRPPEPASVVNWLSSAAVQWPGDPWVGVAALPPHAVTVNAVTAVASDPARNSRLLRALMNIMIPSLYRFFLRSAGIPVRIAGTPLGHRIPDRTCLPR